MHIIKFFVVFVFLGCYAQEQRHLLQGNIAQSLAMLEAGQKYEDALKSAQELVAQSAVQYPDIAQKIATIFAADFVGRVQYPTLAKIPDQQYYQDVLKKAELFIQLGADKMLLEYVNDARVAALVLPLATAAWDQLVTPLTQVSGLVDQKRAELVKNGLMALESGEKATNRAAQLAAYKQAQMDFNAAGFVLVSLWVQRAQLLLEADQEIDKAVEIFKQFTLYPTDYSSTGLHAFFTKVQADCTQAAVFYMQAAQRYHDALQLALDKEDIFIAPLMVKFEHAQQIMEKVSAWAGSAVKTVAMLGNNLLANVSNLYNEIVEIDTYAALYNDGLEPVSWHATLQSSAGKVPVFMYWVRMIFFYAYEDQAQQLWAHAHTEDVLEKYYGLQVLAYENLSQLGLSRATQDATLQTTNLVDRARAWYVQALSDANLWPLALAASFSAYNIALATQGTYFGTSGTVYTEVLNAYAQYLESKQDYAQAAYAQYKLYMVAVGQRDKDAQDKALFALCSLLGRAQKYFKTAQSRVFFEAILQSQSMLQKMMEQYFADQRWQNFVVQTITEEHVQYSFTGCSASYTYSLSDIDDGNHRIVGDMQSTAKKLYDIAYSYGLLQNRKLSNRALALEQLYELNRIKIFVDKLMHEVGTQFQESWLILQQALASCKQGDTLCVVSTVVNNIKQLFHDQVSKLLARNQCEQAIILAIRAQQNDIPDLLHGAYKCAQKNITMMLQVYENTQSHQEDFPLE